MERNEIQRNEMEQNEIKWGEMELNEAKYIKRQTKVNYKQIKQGLSDEVQCIHDTVSKFQTVNFSAHKEVLCVFNLFLNTLYVQRRKQPECSDS